MKRSEKGVLGIILAATLMIGATAVVSANGGTLVDKDSFASKGKIQVKENETDPDPAIVIDSADLVTLANATNELNNQYTNALADAVNNIGSVPKTDRVAAGAQFSDLLSAITNSQAIDSSESVYVLPNGTVTDDSTAEGVIETQITGATEANLSAGTAAWVDGQYIVGTGSDNNSYYASGQDKLIQNAGGHIHNSSCKKLTCTMYITGKPGNYWISHSDYMEWRYLVCHQNCGRAASEHSAHYGNPGAGECPCTAQYTIPAGSHTYWSCGY